jgi:hypothetical protein
MKTIKIVAKRERSSSEDTEVSRAKRVLQDSQYLHANLNQDYKTKGDIERKILDGDFTVLTPTLVDATTDSSSEGSDAESKPLTSKATKKMISKNKVSFSKSVVDRINALSKKFDSVTEQTNKQLDVMNELISSFKALKDQVGILEEMHKEISSKSEFALLDLQIKDLLKSLPDYVRCNRISTVEQPVAPSTSYNPESNTLDESLPELSSKAEYEAYSRSLAGTAFPEFGNSEEYFAGFLDI